MRLVSTWQGHPNQHPGHPHQTLGQCQSATWHPTALGPSTAALSPAPLHSQTVTQLYPEANADAAASVCENVAACEVCESLHKVVEALVRQGSCDTNMLMFMEYHLPGLLSRLAHNGRAR